MNKRIILFLKNNNNNYFLIKNKLILMKNLKKGKIMGSLRKF